MSKNEQKLNSTDHVKKIKDLADILNKYNLSAVEFSDKDRKYRVEREFNKNSSQIKSNVSQKELSTIYSPMVGIFYDNEYMNKKNVIRVGQKFKKGDTLCILEAMKTFTEIKAKEDGEIVEVCAKNGDIIEYSQPLFKYNKS